MIAVANFSRSWSTVESIFTLMITVTERAGYISRVPQGCQRSSAMIKPSDSQDEMAKPMESAIGLCIHAFVSACTDVFFTISAVLAFFPTILFMIALISRVTMITPPITERYATNALGVLSWEYMSSPIFI